MKSKIIIFGIFLAIFLMVSSATAVPKVQSEGIIAAKENLIKNTYPLLTYEEIWEMLFFGSLYCFLVSFCCACTIVGIPFAIVFAIAGIILFILAFILSITMRIMYFIDFIRLILG